MAEVLLRALSLPQEHAIPLAVPLMPIHVPLSALDTKCVISACPLPDRLGQAHQPQPAEHLPCPFIPLPVFYSASPAIRITDEKSGTVAAEGLSDWLVAPWKVALRCHPPHSFSSP